MTTPDDVCGECAGPAPAGKRGRCWRGGAVVSLCARCTAREVGMRRARGEHVPEGYAWVDDLAPAVDGRQLRLF